MVRLTIQHRENKLEIALTKANTPDNSQLKQCRTNATSGSLYDFEGTSRSPQIIQVLSINDIAIEKPLKLVVGDSYTIFRKHQSTHMPNIGLPTNLSKQEAQEAEDLFNLIVQDCAMDLPRSAGNIPSQNPEIERIAVLPQDQIIQSTPIQNENDNSKTIIVPPLPTFFDRIRGTQNNIGCSGCLIVIIFCIAIIAILYFGWPAIAPWSLNNINEILRGVIIGILILVITVALTRIMRE
jgi:hypothetical protein